jgi:hypothetical protein
MWDTGIEAPARLVFKKRHSFDEDVQVVDYPYGMVTDFVFINKLDDHPDKEYIDTECIKHIEEQGDRQEHDTNVKGTMTDWYCAHLPGFKELGSLACEFARTAYPWITHPMAWDTWGNKYTSEQYAAIHWHRPAQISWTYYPKLDPDHPGLFFPDMADGHDAKPGITVLPESGDMLMFLGGTRHGVKPTKFKNPRYVIAGNIFFEYTEMTDEHRLGHHNRANTENRKSILAKMANPNRSTSADVNQAKTVFTTARIKPNES